MRKLILLGAMLGIGLTLSAPADAQVRVVVGPRFHHHWHGWHHHRHWHHGY
jgi:Spy/CpxP family protein refolding chaperone